MCSSPCSSSPTEKNQSGRTSIYILDLWLPYFTLSDLTRLSLTTHWPYRPLSSLIWPPASDVSFPTSNPMLLPATELIFLPQLLQQAEPWPISRTSPISDLFESQLPTTLHPSLWWWGTWWAEPATYNTTSISFLPSVQSQGGPNETPSKGASQKSKTMTGPGWEKSIGLNKHQF